MTHNPNLPSNVAVIVLGVTDVRKSAEFYRDVVGLPLTAQHEGLAFLSMGAITLMLSANLRRAGGQLAGASEIVFSVASVSAAHQLLIERGCRFTHTPHEVTPGSWASTFTDPDGHYLTVFGPK